MTHSLIIALIPAALAAAPADSLRTETLQGKVWIIHLVDPGETLYALSRRYNVEVAAITEANPGAESGLKSGQLLKVPSKARATAPSGKTSVRYHVVAAKETLFSVSKQYQVTVSELLRWNNLTTNELRIGQKLAVSASAATDARQVSPPSSEKTESPVAQARPKQDQTPVRVTPMPDDARMDTGVALLMEGDTDPRKYLALHRTIPYGTVVRVRNKETKEEIFVRIVGTLADGGSGSVMRLSRAAWERLGGKDQLNVEVIYFK